MPDAESWIDRLARRVTRWRARGPGDSWVVAVSGGGDSVGLLRLLHAMTRTIDLRLSVAHLDHGVRDESARADAAFVADLAASLGLPFDLGEWRPERPGHFESDARQARYRWLVEVAQRRGAGVVSVGHTRDDQAETILHRILRGTGPRGLAGIPRRRRLADDPAIDLVRPLLDVSRSEIRAYLGGLGQSFREDASNADTARTRARIRHDLLPRLEQEFNPDVVGAIVRIGEHARSCGRAIETALHDLEVAAVVDLTPARIVLDRGAMGQSPAYLRAELLRRAWRRAGWPERAMSAHRWRRLARLARRGETRGTAVGAGVLAATDGASLILSRPDDGATSTSLGRPADPIPLEVPGEASLPWAGGRIVVEVDVPSAGGEILDRDRLEPPLIIRAPAPGDRFAPLGMDGRSMALADFFRGRGVSRDRRPLIPLVCDRAGIAWVVGHRIADRVKVNDQTQHRLSMSWREPS